MEMNRNKDQSIINDFLDNFSLTRRSFIKKTSAATGTAAMLGGIKPSLKALAAVGETKAGAMG